ncbi:MAG TPA: hypothetical protein VKT32_03160 [Chthonomonadaceae bacterium]|nr:hypothetical protein [Chthonomonadaceae bacterium]
MQDNFAPGRAPLSRRRRSALCDTRATLPRALLLLCSALALLPLIPRASAPLASQLDVLRVVMIGGGPDLENNQVAIESNVRYLGRLLPAGTARTTLFADGDPNHATVLYDLDPPSRQDGEQIVNLLLDDDDSADSSRYRKPQLGGKLDGASSHTAIHRVFGQLSQEEAAAPRPLLLYFTGHGSPDGESYQNNTYDLWGEKQGLSVRELSQELSRLPAGVPVTLVMVQCFSGAFGNLIFEGGRPDGPLASRDLAGFFATVNQRMAAGCTSAVNEADYHDFTSYFFAALTGRDRVGRQVTGADYDGDGRVSMEEAYCYTLIHDASIDVPVCTSDVFVRRFAPLKDRAVFATPYSRVHDWADPAQAAALDALSASLHLTGEDRLQRAYDRMLSGQEDPQETPRTLPAMRRFRMLREEGRNLLLSRWPDLRLSDTAAAHAARQQAIAALSREARSGKWQDLLQAADAVQQALMEREKQEIAESHLIRLVRLGKSVVLARWLEEHGDPEIKARFTRLVAAERRSLLPPVDSLAAKS